MRFSAREDVELEAGTVFAAVSDFAAFERLARRRGIEIRRIDRLARPAVGMAWSLAGRFRGRARSAIAELRHFDPDGGLVLAITGGGFEATFELLVVRLSRARSRVVADLEVRPRSLGARLALQAARLGRKRMVRRYGEGLRSFARQLELVHGVPRA